MANVPLPEMSLENLPSDYKKTFITFTGLMKFLGIDIFGPKLGFSNVNASVRLFIFNFLFLPFTLLQFRLILHLNEAENFLDGAAIFPTIIICTLDLFKMPAAVLMKDEIRELFMEIGELWPKGLGQCEKKEVLNSWLKRIGLIIKSFFIYISINLALFEYVPLLMTWYNLTHGNREYLFPFKLPGLWTVNSTSAYLATYMWETVPTLPSQLCLYHSYDLITIVNTFNLSILFRILQVDLKDAIQASCATRKNMSVSDEDYAKIKNIVITHQKLLSLCDKLNNCFGLVVFTHTALSSLLICFFCFMTVAFGDTVRTIANIISTVNMVSTIFLLALAGQLLCDTSEGVADAAYSSVWYDSDAKVKRLVLFIIIRSQRPCYLSALSFSNMTLTSFSKICSSAYTYLSLLFQMYEK